MTGTEIQTLAESYLDDEDIADADALLWINDYLAEPDLVINAFRKTSTQTLVVADSETWYARTSGHLNIVEIKDLDEDKYTGDYELNYARDYIRIPDPDTYVITSIIMPTASTALSGTPDMNVIFHRHCARYMAGKWKIKDDDTNNDGLRMVADGINGALRAAQLFKNQDKREHQKQKRSTWE